MPDENQIPQSRLNEVIADRNNLREELSKAGQTIEQWKAKAEESALAAMAQKANAEDYKVKLGKLEDMSAQVETLKADNEANMLMASKGITDPATMKYLRYQHGEDGGDKDFGKYLSALQAKPPAYLAAILKPAEPEAPIAPEAPGAPPKPGDAPPPPTPLPGYEGNPQEPGASVGLNGNMTGEEFAKWEAENGEVIAGLGII